MILERHYHPKNKVHIIIIDYGLVERRKLIETSPNSQKQVLDKSKLSNDLIALIKDMHTCAYRV